MDNVQSDKTEKKTQQSAMDTGTDTMPEGADKQKPGAVLAARRKAEGLTEEQIASRLKMTLRQLRALEADDYETLHGIAISRGFVRAYARVLKIDPEPLVAMFGESNPYNVAPPKGISAKTGESFVQNQVSFRKKGNLTGKIVIVLIVLVVAAIVAWNMKLFSFDRQAAKTDKSAVVSAPAASTMQEAQPEVKAQEQKVPENAQVVPDKGQQNQPASVDSGNGKAATPAAAVMQPSENRSHQIQSGQVGGTTASVQDGTSRLNMNFSEKSWVRVQANDGTILAEYMGVPGEQRSLDVTGPVTVIVGYAPGVSMTFRGAPVDLESRAVNSVARISLK